METPILFQRDISRPVARRAFVFCRLQVLNYTFPTRPRSSGTVQLLLRTSFVIVPLLIPFCTSHISPIFISFFVIQHSFHIYSSSSFWSHHLFSSASSSSLSIVIISHVGIIWTYLSQIFAIFLHQGVVLGCFPLVYHVITMHWPFSVRFSWLSHTPLIIAMHQSWSFVSLNLKLGWDDELGFVLYSELSRYLVTVTVTWKK
ncbi:hypothetical protein BYT27DRAFT_6505317 [Phlegmacium glaucopus]|nr:hypothetical protein BYT27DRAFT_6505317 [Phlegmacium glaucopus]